MTAISSDHIIARLRAGFTDHNYALQIMHEAADRIEALQTQGTAMARRLDELEHLQTEPRRNNPPRLLGYGVILATSTDRTATIQLDHTRDRWTKARRDHARVLIAALPTT